MLSYLECKGLSFYELLMTIRERYKDLLSFSWWEDGGPIDITYDQMVKHVLLASDFLNRKGMKGKRIAISGINSYDIIVDMLAAFTMGAVAVMIDLDLDDRTLKEEFEKLSPAMIICRADEIERIKELGWDDIAPVYLAGYDESHSIGEVPYQHIGSDSCFEMRDKPDLEAPSLMLRTSGSTGTGKWVILPQRALWPHDTSPTGRQVLILPLYHVAVISAVVDNICQGVHLCISNMQNGLRDIGWFRPKLLLAVPIFLKMMVKKAEKGELDLSCFEIIGSGGAQEDQSVSRYIQSLGIVSLSLYGATETMGAVGYSAPDKLRAGSVGCIGSWNQVLISDEGEVLIKGSNIMTGYFGDEEATNKALSGGWFHTGDKGYIDKDGFLYITGRLKNTIILSNGENVNPEFIESRLSSCEAIQEVLVSGEDDILVAYLYCSGPDGDLKDKAKEYVDAYNKKVPLYHRIRKVHFVDRPFEKTSSGKIKRK